MSYSARDSGSSSSVDSPRRFTGDDGGSLFSLELSGGIGDGVEGGAGEGGALDGGAGEGGAGDGGAGVITATGVSGFAGFIVVVTVLFCCTLTVGLTGLASCMLAVVALVAMVTPGGGVLGSAGGGVVGSWGGTSSTSESDQESFLVKSILISDFKKISVKVSGCSVLVSVCLMALSTLVLTCPTFCCQRNSGVWLRCVSRNKKKIKKYTLVRNITNKNIQSLEIHKDYHN